jgi:hypothetical protein
MVFTIKGKKIHKIYFNIFFVDRKTHVSITLGILFEVEPYLEGEDGPTPSTAFSAVSDFGINFMFMLI